MMTNELTENERIEVAEYRAALRKAAVKWQEQLEATERFTGICKRANRSLAWMFAVVGGLLIVALGYLAFMAMLP